jgi:hypothetical protein
VNDKKDDTGNVEAVCEHFRIKAAIVLYWFKDDCWNMSHRSQEVHLSVTSVVAAGVFITFSLGDVSLLRDDKLSLNQWNKNLLCHGTTTQNVSEDPTNAWCLCCSWNDTSLCCEHMNGLPFDRSGEQFIVQQEHGNGTRRETARQQLAFTQDKIHESGCFYT